MSDCNIEIEALPDENNNLNLTVLNALLTSLTKETRENAKVLKEVQLRLNKRERSISDSDANFSDSKKQRTSDPGNIAGPSVDSGHTKTTGRQSNNDSDSSADEDYSDSFAENFLINDSNPNDELSVSDPLEPTSHSSSTTSSDFPIMGPESKST